MAGRQGVVGVVELVQAEGELADGVLALQPGGGFADTLDGGQQEADQDADDGVTMRSSIRVNANRRCDFTLPTHLRMTSDFLTELG